MDDATLQLLFSLSAMLDDGDVDGALDAGLMDVRPEQPTDANPTSCKAIATIFAAQSRLRAAWAARDRYRIRAARLLARQQARAAKRLVAAGAASAVTGLPPAAAAALARAKSKAARST